MAVGSGFDEAASRVGDVVGVSSATGSLVSGVSELSEVSGVFDVSETSDGASASLDDPPPEDEPEPAPDRASGPPPSEPENGP
ncbi:hypothetical protein SAZ11_30525 [Streptomyces sp. FXJ1.4098]|nr:hypothetical protein [Streptomyces sp. FXJ1.4098]